jgi:2-iminobutanoate/2-iminopropanoate deaminase
MVDTMKLINVPGIAAPGGHYSPAVEVDGLVFVSGQLPVAPQGHTLKDAPFEAQAEQVMDNCVAVLQAAGCALTDVVKTTAYVVGVDNWPAFNQVYARRMGAHKPARAVVPVPALHYGYLIEVEMVARKR